MKCTTKSLFLITPAQKPKGKRKRRKIWYASAKSSNTVQMLFT